MKTLTRNLGCLLLLTLGLLACDNQQNAELATGQDTVPVITDSADDILTDFNKSSPDFDDMSEDKGSEEDTESFEGMTQEGNAPEEYNDIYEENPEKYQEPTEGIQSEEI